MKKRLSIAATVLAVVALGLIFALPSQGATGGKVADHSTFDQTSGDTSVNCRTTNSGGFDVYMSFRAITADAVLRVHFQDGDFVDYPIPVNTSFSIQQAAGTTNGVDDRIKVTSEGTGDLVGWMSASRLPTTDTKVLCNTFPQ